jgi:hypothetical protein
LLAEMTLDAGSMWRGRRVKVSASSMVAILLSRALICGFENTRPYVRCFPWCCVEMLQIILRTALMFLQG